LIGIQERRKGVDSAKGTQQTEVLVVFGKENPLAQSVLHHPISIPWKSGPSVSSGAGTQRIEELRRARPGAPRATACGRRAPAAAAAAVPVPCARRGAASSRPSESRYHAPCSGTGCAPGDAVARTNTCFAAPSERSIPCCCRWACPPGRSHRLA